MNQHPDLLVVTHRVPYPPDKGDRIRTYHLLKYLSRHAAIHLASLTDEPVPEATWRELKLMCRQVAIAPLGPGRWLRGLRSFICGSSISEGVFESPALAQTIKSWTAEIPFHATVASSSSVARFLRLDGLSRSPAVVDLIDVDSQKWFDYARASMFPKSLLYRAEGMRLRRTEKAIPSWARATTLVSESETRLFRSISPEANAHTVTNGVDLAYFREVKGFSEETAGICVFVGAFDYRPNIDAACWFAEKVWPEIRQTHVQARFQLVGRNPSKAVRQLASIAGVEVIGTVPDVRPHLSQATLVVAPLQIARGLQNKVLEALAMGKAVVASSQALAGFRADIPAVRAVDREQWVAAISRLFNDPSERARLGRAGRAFAELHHNWDLCLEPFRELLGLGEVASAELAGVLPLEAAS